MLYRQFRSIRPEINLSVIASLRILLGLMFLSMWLSNLLKGVYTPHGFLEFFTSVFPLSQNPITWYAAFIQNIILPIRHIYAPFQMIVEFSIGISLLFGIFSRLSSLVGIFFLLNIYLATFGQELAWVYLLPVAILIVVIRTKAGRSMGFDALLARRYEERKFSFW